MAAGIRCYNVESAAELENLNAVAGRAGRVAPVSLRVNPNVDPNRVREMCVALAQRE